MFGVGGFQHGFLTTVHSYTNDHENLFRSHGDGRMAKVLPWYDNKWG